MQCSCEHYKLDKDKLLLFVLASDVDGTTMKLIKVFTRCDSDSRTVSVLNWTRTQGWTALKYWPPMALGLIQIRLHAVSIIERDHLDELWSSEPPKQLTLKSKFSHHTAISDPKMLLFTFEVSSLL